jgi:hypothetical protein
VQAEPDIRDPDPDIQSTRMRHRERHDPATEGDHERVLEATLCTTLKNGYWVTVETVSG